MKDNRKSQGLYGKYLKRFIDIVCGVFALILLSWLYAVVAVSVRVKLGSPVIFTQNRPGKDGKIFKLYKFRTMTDERDENGKLLPDDVRLTKFGKFLRMASLDELPEIFNIIKGDMSFVGPRPLLVEYLPYYNEREQRRHEVRPGLTGWAQVNGRNSVNWTKRFELDVEYVENLSLGFDIKILLSTVKKVLAKSDVAEDTNAVEGNFAAEREAEMKEKVR